MEHAQNLKSVKVKLQELLTCMTVEEKETEKLSPEEKEIYERGMEAGIAQPFDLTSGETFDRETEREIYDRGATLGQLLGRLKEVEYFTAGEGNRLEFTE